MEDPEEHALVVKALIDGLGGCLMWDGREAAIVIQRHSLKPSLIRQETIQYVRKKGGDVVIQRREVRDNWKDKFRFYYMVILPFSGFQDGLFIEMRLTDNDDPDLPMVTIVGSHPEIR